MKAMQGMLAVLVLFVGLCTVAGAEAGSKQLHTLFIVTVDQGPSEGLVVQGKLTADVDPGTGVLSGTLTPGPNPSTGLPYTSVVFTTVGGTLVPNPHVTALEVRGRLEHHAVNLILLNAGGPGQHIFGVGTSEHDTGQGLQHAPGAVGGPAAGPQAGDLGDWEAPCCSLR
jgi:hypothetical protein